MLLRFDALRAGRFLTEVQELPDLVPEGGELTKTSFRNIGCDCFRSMSILAGNHCRRPLLK